MRDSELVGGMVFSKNTRIRSSHKEEPPGPPGELDFVWHPVRKIQDPLLDLQMSKRRRRGRSYEACPAGGNHSSQLS